MYHLPPLPGTMKYWLGRRGGRQESPPPLVLQPSLESLAEAPTPIPPPGSESRAVSNLPFSYLTKNIHSHPQGWWGNLLLKDNLNTQLTNNRGPFFISSSPLASFSWVKKTLQGSFILSMNIYLSIFCTSSNETRAVPDLREASHSHMGYENEQIKHNTS